jgi:pimeloyl-ACP methyl ester carboxylesterase
VDPALLIHSGGFTSRQWRKLSELLAPRYRILAPDLLGYGAPWPIAQPFHFREDVALLASLLDEPAHLVGHSYGGFLALQLALARPDRVLSLALYEPVAFAVLTDAERAAVDGIGTYNPGTTGIDETWLAGFVDWWNGPNSWPRLSDDARNAFRSVGWKLSQEVVSLATDRSDYAPITAPTLVLGGSLTPAVERIVVERLATTLPNATSQILPGLGHMGPITHAAQVNALLAAHLDASSE